MRLVQGIVNSLVGFGQRRKSGQELGKIPKALQSQAGSLRILDPGKTRGGRVALSCLSFRAGGGFEKEAGERETNGYPHY